VLDVFTVLMSHAYPYLKLTRAINIP